ncbi:RNA polymerase sigma factor, partial [bacterium]|nr:RNA polymerase sigma factor [bacterium]MBU1985258.1 RNA polymerase sigma factor [bacterium]
TQRTFIRCYLNLRRYDPRRPFRPWLYRIHLNGCKSAARNRGRRSERFVSVDSAILPVDPVESTGVEEIILRQIDRLPPRQKAAFILIEIENHTSPEAAEILGCSDSTVRVHLARAKETLRRRLTELGIEY